MSSQLCKQYHYKTQGVARRRAVMQFTQLTRHETNNYANTFLHIKHLSNIFMEHIKIEIMLAFINYFSSGIQDSSLCNATIFFQTFHPSVYQVGIHDC